MNHLMMMIKCFLAVFLILQATSETAVSATVYTVGDSMGWAIPNSTDFYSQWAKNKTFSVGDTLVFNWTNIHDVASVSQDVYDKCSTTAVSSNQIAGYRYNITANGSYYFICTIGKHCSEGQKLSIKTGDQQSAAPPSSFTVFPPILYYALILVYSLAYI